MYLSGDRATQQGSRSVLWRKTNSERLSVVSRLSSAGRLSSRLDVFDYGSISFMG